MDGLLTAVKTVTRDSRISLEPAGESRLPTERKTLAEHDVASPEHILSALKSKPDHEQLFEILSKLDPASEKTKIKHFDIRVPSPITAQILQVLASTTIPDHWSSTLNASSKGTGTRYKARAALLRSLSSVAGLNSLVAQLRSLIVVSRSTSRQLQSSGSKLHIQALLSVLSALLKPGNFISRLHTDMLAICDNDTQKQITWRELISLVAASRVLSTAAEALTSIREPNYLSPISWIGEGFHYASWLGGNICHMASKIDLYNELGWESAALLAGRALSLGYSDQLVREIYTGLLVDRILPEKFSLLLDHLRPTEQLAILEAIFRDIEKKHFSEELSGVQEDTASETINDIAALCAAVIGNRPYLEARVLEWLSKGQGGSINTAGLRRAILAVFSPHKE